MAFTAKKEGRAPSKTTMNLYFKEKKPLRPQVLIPCVLVLAALAGLFAKFAVADRFAGLEEARAALESERRRLQTLRDSYADYGEVQDEYMKYNYNNFDRSIVSRMDILDLLERVVFPPAGVRTLTISGNTMSMTLTGLTLDEVSDMLHALEAEELVRKVTVSTTGYGGRGEESGTPMANMTVEFNPADAEGGEG